MSYIADNFGVLLNLSPNAGLVSGLALLFFGLTLASTAVMGRFAPSLQRSLLIPSFHLWKRYLKRSHKDCLSCIDPWEYTTPLFLSTVLDVLAVGALLLLIATAAVSKSAYLGCSCFFVGAAFYLSFLGVFSTAAEGFTFVGTNIFTCWYLCFVAFSLFVLVQLITHEGVATYSYRGIGVLFFGIGVVPLFHIVSDQDQQEEGEEPTELDTYPRAPKLLPLEMILKAGSPMASQIKSLASLFPAWTWHWGLSLLPLFIWAFYSLARAANPDSGVIVLAVVIANELALRMNNNEISEDACLILSVVNRLIMLLVGQWDWLIGTVIATLLSSTILYVQWLGKALPFVSSKLRGALLHSALVTVISKQQLQQQQEQQSSSQEAATTPTSRFARIIGKIPTALLLVVYLQVVVGVLIAIGAAKSPTLVLEAINGVFQVSWVGYIWFLWVAVLAMFSANRVLARNGFGPIDFSEQILLAAAENVPTTSSTASLAIAALFGAISDSVRPNMDEKAWVGVLLIVTWLLALGSTILAAILSKIWLIIPLAALLPVSIVLFCRFLHKWQQAGCPVSTEVTSLNRETAQLFYLPSSLFVLAIGLAAIPKATSLLAVYVGLWILGAAGTSIVVARWRSTITVDRTLLGLLGISWVPVMIWCITYGLSNPYKSAAAVVIMLLMATTTMQLFTLAGMVWSDCLQNGADEVKSTTALVSPIAFLRLLLSAGFALIAILLIIFACFVSTPLGVSLIMLQILVMLFCAVKVGVLRADGAILGFLTEKTSLSTYFKKHQAVFILLAVLAVLVCGIFGAISHPSYAWWWASFSWITLAFVSLVYGVYDLLSSPPKVYGVYYYPVYSLNVALNTLENVSFKSSFVLLFFAMMSIWSVWVSIVVQPSSTGVELFIVSSLVLAIYMRFMSSSSGNAKIDQGIVASAKADALKRIYLAEKASDAPSSPALKSTSEILRTVSNDLKQKIKERDEAEEKLNQIIAKHATLGSDLSPIPFVYLFGIAARKNHPKKSNAGAGAGAGGAGADDSSPTTATAYPRQLSIVRGQTANPMMASASANANNSDTRLSDQSAAGRSSSSLENVALGSDLESLRDSIPVIDSFEAVTFEEIAHHELLGAYRDLVQKTTDLNKYRALHRLKSQSAGETFLLLKSNELVSFLRQEEVLKAANQPDEQIQKLRSMPADELLCNFPTSALRPLVEKFKKSLDDQAAMAAAASSVSTTTSEIDQGKAEEKANLLRLAQEERARAAKEKPKAAATSSTSVSTRQSFPVSGRYGVPTGADLTDVVKSLTATLSRTSTFRDDEFDVENQLEDVLGTPSQLATNASNNVPVSMTDVYQDLIDKSQKETKLAHGIYLNPDPTQINQGGLGDCYLLSALAALAEKPNLVKKLFPLLSDRGGQSADSWRQTQETCAAAGIFAVRLFFNGEFRTIILDDVVVGLPNSGRPAFAHGLKGKEHQSIWVMLVEKAYAKLHGSFAVIEGGLENLAMEDFTGGIPGQVDELHLDTESKFDKILGLYEGGHLLGASSNVGSDKDTSSEGIVYGHAYTILSVRKVDQYRLLKLRNPWGGVGGSSSSSSNKGGYKSEWTGPWSDKSPEWTERYKRLLNFQDKDDGEFWIELSDFVRNFRLVYYCQIFPIAGGGSGADGSINVASEGDDARFLLRQLPRQDNASDAAYCQWRRKGKECGTAGGCQNFDTYANNPQFVMVSSEDCTATLVLSQKETISAKASLEEASRERNGALAIGLGVYNCGGQKVVGKAEGATDVACSASYQTVRDVVLEFKVTANEPLTIVPSTFEPGKEDKFTLRLFASLPKAVPNAANKTVMTVDLLTFDEYQRGARGLPPSATHTGGRTLQGLAPPGSVLTREGTTGRLPPGGRPSTS